MSRIIDTHCHPQFPQYDHDRQEVIRRALDAGVRMVCVGTDEGTSRSAIALAERYEGLYASVGLHPNDDEDEIYDPRVYERLVQHQKVVAIGEVGLDYYRVSSPEKRIKQRDRFSQQIKFAQHTNKPLIIHCRDAHDDMLEMLPAYRGVIHSFTGTTQQAEAYIRKGYMIGLNGIITFTKQHDDLIRNLSLEHIVLETDAPYLAPTPHRGERNEPAFVSIVAEKITLLRGITLDQIASATVANSVSVFGIDYI